MGRLIFTLSVLFLVRLLPARPIDSKAAKDLPALQEIIVQIQGNRSLSAVQIADLTTKLQADEPVIVALAAWALSHSNAPRDQTIQQLEKIEPKTYGVSTAFVKMARARLDDKDPAKFALRLKELTKNENPYLQVEAAKELSSTDPSAAKPILEKVAGDSANPARNEARRALKSIDATKQVPPPDPIEDDAYEALLAIFREAAPLAKHALFGEMPQGDTSPPFTPAIARLRLQWALTPDAPPEPLEIRWIAADVAGVEKNHVIATAKSEPDKNEGEFTLKKPTAGFPPGQYRIEIWQSGKMISSEEFQIKPD